MVSTNLRESIHVLCRVWGDKEGIVASASGILVATMHFARSERGANLVHGPGAHMVFNCSQNDGESLEIVTGNYFCGIDAVMFSERGVCMYHN